MNTKSSPGFWRSFWKALMGSGWFNWNEKPNAVAASKETSNIVAFPKVQEQKRAA